MKKYICVSLLGLLFPMLGCEDKVAAEPAFSLSETSLSCTQEAAQYEVEVESNVDWTASVPGDAPWCTATNLGDRLLVDLEENTGLEMRQTEITVTAGPLVEKVEVKQLGENPDILFDKERQDLSYGDTLVTVKILSNVDYEVSVPDGVDWIASLPDTRTMSESTCRFQITENESDSVRYASVSFHSADGKVERKLMFRQDFRNKDYVPGDPSELGDILIAVESGEANQSNSQEESIEMSFDGTTSTWYHSPWYSTSFPVELTYSFATPQVVDYLVYKPRGSGANGNFDEFDLLVSTTKNTSYTKVGSYRLGGTTQVSKIVFDTPLEGVTSFRFSVNSAIGDVVSCGEMEFYRKAAPIAGLEEVFADELYSELKPDVDQRKIDGIENTFFRSIAQSLFDKTYDLKYRVQEYEPYRELDDLAAEMKTSGYNPFENPTGIYFSDGEEAIVIVGDMQGESLSLKVYDFDGTRQGLPTPEPTSYPLERGINKLRISHGGLAYMDYYTSRWETAPRLKVHIASGKVNGYFDKKRDSSADWKQILNSATYGCLDIKGDYINLVYGVNSLKQYCDDGLKLIQNYDAIVDLEHEIMGLKKYNRLPKNHMFARVVKDGLFADGWGAGFGEWSMNELASPTKSIKEGVWCIAHELGHVNQIRPGLKWVSTTEVTNNVYSVCARYKFNREYLNLEQERCNDGDNNNVLGGRFNSYLNYGIVKGEHWLCQKGQDNMDPNSYPNGGDHFVKLCPLWQLLLYYREIVGGEKRDWYGDVAEIVRNTDESGLSNGQLNLNFMRNTMDVVKEDLTDFFIKCGMLKPIDKELDDYARGWMTITQEECDEMVRYASRYPKPATPVLYYLSGNSEKAFKEKLPVEGTYGEGLRIKSDGNIVVSHDVWKNAAVFETYEGDELKYVALVGTDSSDLSSTLVRYPSGSTRIEAVAWDGTRTLVYGER